MSLNQVTKIEMTRLVNDKNRARVKEALRLVGYNDKEAETYIADINSETKSLFTRDRRYQLVLGATLLAGAGAYLAQTTGHSRIAGFLINSCALLPMMGLFIGFTRMSRPYERLDQLLATADYQKQIMEGRISHEEIPQAYRLDRIA